MSIVTPQSDYALETLAKHLQARVNAKYQGAISGISAYDHLPKPVTQYPHLALFDTGGEGYDLEFRRVTARYTKLQNVEQRGDLPGEFRVLQLVMIEALKEYEDEDKDFAIVIPAPQNFEYRIPLRQIGDGLYPFFELSFTVLDRSEVG